MIFTESIIDKKQAIIRIIDRIFLQDLPFFLSGDDVVPTKKIFQWIAENTGNLINIEAIASLFHLSAKQIHRSIEFLRSSYLIYDVAPYFRDKSREYSSRSKLYLHDVSLLSYTRNIWDDTFMTDGKITETLVVHALEKTLRE